MPDSQKGIQVRGEWVGGGEVDAVCFLAAGGSALLSPPPLSRKGGKEKQWHVTCVTGMAADPGVGWGGGAGMPVCFSSQYTLFGGQTSLGLWHRRAP